MRPSAIKGFTKEATKRSIKPAKIIGIGVGGGVIANEVGTTPNWVKDLRNKIKGGKEAENNATNYNGNNGFIDIDNNEKSQKLWKSYR